MDFSGESAGAGAYGAGLSSGAFDPISFIKKPQVILRLSSWLLSIIVFGCISSEGWIEPNADMGRVCQYYGDVNGKILSPGDPGPCNYGTAIGVIAFLASMGFLVVDAMFDNMSNVKTRRYAVLGDLAFSGLWAFMWFVGFCYLADTWRRGADWRALANPTYTGVSTCQAAIAFSFFSIGTWAASGVFAFLRYRSGITEQFSAYGSGGAGYAPTGDAGAVGQPPAAGYSEQPFAGQSEGGSSKPYQ